MTNDDRAKIFTGFLCFVVLPLGIALALKLKRRWDPDRPKGQALFAPIVQANGILFRDEPVNAAALALVCFDPDTPALRRELLQLAARCADLKDAPAFEPDQAELVQHIRNEKTRFDEALPVPFSLTGGRTIYAVSVMIKREYLPDNVLNRKFIYGYALPERPELVAMIPDDLAVALSRK